MIDSLPPFGVRGGIFLLLFCVQSIILFMEILCPFHKRFKGGLMMYKVSEVAKIAGVTQSAVYKAIKQLNGQYVSVENGRTMVTDEGLEYLKERFKTKEDPGQQYDIVRALMSQLEEKDRQLAEKDRQIAQLIEQSKNYQILLKTEQDKMVIVAQEKPKLLARLFHRDK